MSRFTRPDGALPVTDLSPARRMMAVMQPARSSSVVFFGATLPVARAQALLERVNQGDGPKVTFYHLMLACIARAMHERPHLNRFVKGGVIYQREQVSLSFSVKKEMSDRGKLSTVKVAFDATDTVFDVAAKVDAAIAQGRAPTESAAEHTSSSLLQLPRFVLRGLLGLADRLEGLGLLPASLLRDDPLQTSANVANVGSIGIDGVYHHLFDHGTSSLMVSLGKVALRPVVDAGGRVVAAQTVDIKFAIDERICDGFYLAKSLEALLQLLEHPDRLAARGVVADAA